jgi:4-diphosphocytidyl-2-C-methyl-D-erythritol kinase
MTVLRARAPGKVNLALYLGPIRPTDGKHELVSLIEPVTLADWLELGPARGREDEVVCEGVVGRNLAADAVARFRAATAWNGPPVRLTIFKQVPVAAGMGGGSADAAAALRLTAKTAGLPVPDQIAAELGADVPAALHAGPAIMAGAGERLTPVDALPPHAFVFLPAATALSTAAVYAKADRLGLPRTAADLADRRADIDRALAAGELPLHNDLEPAARALCPDVDAALADVRAAGARHALVCGSGPTAAGLFGSLDEAKLAAGDLRERYPKAAAAAPAPRGYAAPRAFA